MEDPTERWLPVVGWEGLYEVSDLGNVRSLRRVLKPGLRKGYLAVTLWRDGKGQHWQVHRLVATAFIGPCPPGMETLHGPGGMFDNRPANLSFGTHRQNIQDKIRDGTMSRGESHGLAKLTEAQVTEIRERYSAGENQYALARVFGVDQTTISPLLSGKTWGHVPGAIAAPGPARGAALPQAKLTAVIVAQCRARRAAGETLTALCAEFGISPGALSQAVTGKTWRHI